MWCYGTKFLPTIITVVVAQCVSFITLCPIYSKPDDQCFYVYPDADGDASWGGWGDKSNVILAVQHFALTIIVLHFGNNNSGYAFPAFFLLILSVASAVFRL